MRIVSTVPSITELLADFKLNQEVVGITKFCVHPNEWFRIKTRIGGTKTLNTEAILGLKPDWIFANKEENVKEQISALEPYASVMVTDIKRPDDNLALIMDIARLVNNEALGNLLHQQLYNTISDLSGPVLSTAAYLIWKDPYMTIGNDTYIHSIMELMGLENIYKNRTRYPEIELEELKEKQPDYILLSSEPFPFREIHRSMIAQSCPLSTVICVDGEAFSWYGTRLIKKKNYMTQLKNQLSI